MSKDVTTNLNIGSGELTSIGTIASYAFDHFGLDFEKYIDGYYGEENSKYHLADISKIKAIGWSPRITISECIRDFINRRCTTIG